MKQRKAILTLEITLIIIGFFGLFYNEDILYGWFLFCVFVVHLVIFAFSPNKKEEEKDNSRRNINVKSFGLLLKAMKGWAWRYLPDSKLFLMEEGAENIGEEGQCLFSKEDFLRLVFPEDRAIVTEGINSFYEHNNLSKTLQYRIKPLASGTYEWYETLIVIDTQNDEKDVPSLFYGASMNITNRKEKELRLRKKNERITILKKQMELILDNAQVGLAYFDRDMKLVWENLNTHLPRYTDICKLMEGKSCSRLECNYLGFSYRCAIKNSIAFDKIVQQEIEVDGSFYERTAIPIKDDKGIRIGTIFKVNDLTDKRYIKQLKEATAKAQRSDKLKSAFLANMSHEIRTPLNSIIGFSSLMIEEEDPKERKSYNELIEINNELLLNIINDILDLSKIEAGYLEFNEEEFDLIPVLTNLLISQKKNKLDKGVEMKLENPYKFFIIKKDKNRLLQIIINLVSNAKKYTHSGFIEIGCSYEDKQLRIYVKDTGIGISEEKKKKLFQRFEKLDNFTQGTGLGLSICKALVKKQKGEIGCESKEGEGSTFWFTIPCKARFELL